MYFCFWYRAAQYPRQEPSCLGMINLVSIWFWNGYHISMVLLFFWILTLPLDGNLWNRHCIQCILLISSKKICWILAKFKHWLDKNGGNWKSKWLDAHVFISSQKGPLCCKATRSWGNYTTFNDGLPKCNGNDHMHICANLVSCKFIVMTCWRP